MHTDHDPIDSFSVHVNSAFEESKQQRFKLDQRSLQASV